MAQTPCPRERIAEGSVPPRSEVVFSLFPGTFARVTLDEEIDWGPHDRILVLLIVLSVVCVAAADSSHSRARPAKPMSETPCGQCFANMIPPSPETPKII